MSFDGSGPTILTAGGSYFSFLEPELHHFSIYDVATALSNLCRFNGHTRMFYSVAQHSMWVSKLVPPEYALQGLLHDAAEAYLGDVTRPLKNLLPQYSEIEHRVEQALFAYFKLPPVLHESVKEADLVMLATEDRDLMPPHADVWPILRGVRPMSYGLIALDPQEARERFLRRYNEIVSGTA